LRSLLLESHLLHQVINAHSDGLGRVKIYGATRRLGTRTYEDEKQKKSHRHSASNAHFHGFSSASCPFGVPGKNAGRLLAVLALTITVGRRLYHRELARTRSALKHGDLTYG